MTKSLAHTGTAVRLVLADLAKLEIPTIATAVAGIAAPIILALFNVDFAPTVIAGWLTLAGAVAATLQKIASGQTAPPPPAPGPPVPPTPVQ